MNQRQSTELEPVPDDFACQRCGNCCRWPGYVRLDNEDIAAAAAFLGMESEDFIERHTTLAPDRQSLAVVNRGDGPCGLYQDTPPGCAVHSAKPKQCRAFPRQWNFPGWQKLCVGGGGKKAYFGKLKLL